MSLASIHVMIFDIFREQHQIEVSAMENKVKSLEVELDKTRKTSYETTVPLEAKVGLIEGGSSCF